MKKLKIIDIIFMSLSLLTFLGATAIFHDAIFIQIFGKTLHSRLINLILESQSIYGMFLGWSTLSIVLGLGMTIIKILQKQWLASILLLGSTAASGLLIFDFLIAINAIFNRD
ncbi:MAG: hypothetical protein ACM65M_16945 [Microcoleus sp.]